MLKHILPNAVAPIIVQSTLGVAAAILSCATLSFLGMGIQPPQASGAPCSRRRASICATSRIWAVFPGLFIMITVFSLNIVGRWHPRRHRPASQGLTEVTGMNDLLLEIKNLTVQYRTRKGNVEAVNGIDLNLRRGETLGLVGETGAGKTTTALAIMRLLPVPPAVVPNGEIFFEGRDLRKLSPNEVRKVRGEKISMIYRTR